MAHTMTAAEIVETAQVAAHWEIVQNAGIRAEYGDPRDVLSVRAHGAGTGASIRPLSRMRSCTLLCRRKTSSP